MSNLCLILLACSLVAQGGDQDASTPLLAASDRDDMEAVTALLRGGERVNAANDLGVTPLWAACQNGNAAMVKKLLDAGANPNAALLAGETPLMMAARTGNVDIVEMLLAKHANPNARAARGQTALMWAASQKHPDVVKALVANSADVHARSERWSQMMAVPPHGFLPYNMLVPFGGDTPLLFAARAGDLDSAKLLVGAGANVNDADAWGVSATMFAAHSGFPELVEFLLDHGADANAAKAGFTALHEAIMRRDERMIKALLDHRANPNALLRSWTPTRRSSRDLNFQPELVGASPYWLAARFLQPAAMRLLVERGADPLFVHYSNHVSDGRFEHHSEITTAVTAALGMGGGKAWVEVDRGNREAMTLETVKLAATHGVDLKLSNTDGRTALDAAKALKFSTIVSYLAPLMAQVQTEKRPGISATALAPDPNMPRPIDARDSVFMEELTWLEVRDAMRAGKTTVIIATGGVEQNGPYLVSGKHNIVLRATTEAIARKLGNALVAPIVAFVPEGDISPPTGHMKYPATISLRQSTFKALLTDIAESLKSHGFQHLILIGDSGGNQTGMKEVAAELTAAWTGGPAAIHFIPEYYDFYDGGSLSKWLESQGIHEKDEGYHDNVAITAMMMAVDPTAVRMSERRAKNKFSINGVSLDPADEMITLGKRAVASRANVTVEAIHKAFAAK
ncbi:MAG: ankyrin repeat domain-containing protein [Acidobacteriota bacterium]